MKVSEIIRRTGVCRHQVDKWVRLRELPERSRIAAKPGMPGFYYGYLAKRWAQGCQNVRVLLREIRNLGYKGSYSWLARVLSPWRAETGKAPQSHVRCAVDVSTLTPSQRISPKVAASLLIKLPQALSARQRHTINYLKQNCPGFAKLRQLALGFRTILLRGTPTSLRDWMQRARQTGMPALNRFVKNLWRDFAAVSAAVTTSWSNGPIEGHINRLKVIKRHMYGRAGTELLRARLLPIPSQIANRVHQT